MIGRARPELRPDLRSFPYGAYLILYRAIDDGVEIVRVVHAARNLDELIRGLGAMVSDPQGLTP
jgi:toxin ParE1/3/4